MAAANAAGDPGSWRRLLEEDNSPDDDGDDDADGCDLEWVVKSTDPCEDAVCVHGSCNSKGSCDCEAAWAGPVCNATEASFNVSEALTTERRATESDSSNATVGNVTISAFDELLAVADTLTTAASSGYLDTGCELKTNPSATAVTSAGLNVVRGDVSYRPCLVD
jgi:hypothetical protein